MVSVIMPAYNAEKYIGPAIESILSQTYRDFEFIIVNDHSRDSTEEIILSYQDDRIRYIKNEENLGVAATLNRALSLAKGAYVARMDADDLSLPQRLEKQAAYLDTHPEVAVLGTNVETFDENGPLFTGWSATDPAQMKVDLFFSCGLAHPSVMMRRRVIEALGGYDRAFEGLEDYDLWCRVSQSHGVTTLPDLLFRYRVHGGQVTKNPSPQYLQRLRALKSRQLSELGLSDEYLDVYFHLCTGKRPEKTEEILTAVAFFEAARKANRSYDPKLLAASFRGILLPPSAALPGPQRKEVFRATTLVSPTQIAKFRAKRTLKRLLGR